MLNKKNFSKENRLLNKAQFQKVFSNRQRLYSSHFLLYHCPNSLSHARLGLITSKRNAKHAVSRNRIRRHVREVFRQHPLRALPMDIIVIAKQSAAKTENEEIQQCIDKQLKRLLKGFKEL